MAPLWCPDSTYTNPAPLLSFKCPKSPKFNSCGPPADLKSRRGDAQSHRTMLSSGNASSAHPRLLLHPRTSRVRRISLTTKHLRESVLPAADLAFVNSFRSQVFPSCTYTASHQYSDQLLHREIWQHLGHLSCSCRAGLHRRLLRARSRRSRPLCQASSSNLGTLRLQYRQSRRMLWAQKARRLWFSSTWVVPRRPTRSATSSAPSSYVVLSRKG